MTISQRKKTPDPPNSPPTADEFVLGVDGGGTQTTAWLARSRSAPVIEPLGTGLAGPGNPRAVGFDAAQANIAAAIAAAFHQACIPQHTVGNACLGLAGAGRPPEQQKIREWAVELEIAATVRVTHDAELVLAAGCQRRTGVALISGTGSLAWGRNESGETARAGGWGWRMGDEGSGYAIAIAGLRAAAKAADGQRPQTVLLEAFQKLFDVRSPADLVKKMHGPQMTSRRIADLSRVVFDASTTDQTARDIVRTAAADLANMVETLVRRLQLRSQDFDLACAGGVIVHQPLLRQALLEGLKDQGIIPTHCNLVTEPVVGAVILAMQQ